MLYARQRFRLATAGPFNTAGIAAPTVRADLGAAAGPVGSVPAMLGLKLRFDPPAMRQGPTAARLTATGGSPV